MHVMLRSRPRAKMARDGMVVGNGMAARDSIMAGDGMMVGDGIIARDGIMAGDSMVGWHGRERWHDSKR